MPLGKMNDITQELKEVLPINWSHLSKAFFYSLCTSFICIYLCLDF